MVLPFIPVDWEPHIHTLAQELVLMLRRKHCQELLRPASATWVTSTSEVCLVVSFLIKEVQLHLVCD